MSYKLGVLVVHGMGSQKAGFAKKMEKEIESRLKMPNTICWQEGLWADVLADREEYLYRRLTENHDLDLAFIRKFIVSSFGDALAYQRIPGPDQDVYYQIHEAIRASLGRLRSRLGGDLPIVVIAHSLGCHIISNYTWDQQRAEEEPELKRRKKIHRVFGGNDLEKMNTLAGIITCGCNIPLFSLAYKEPSAIKFPPPGLPKYFPKATGPKLKAAAKWCNYYDRDDVLGYPLKPLSESFEESVSADIPIDVGLPFVSMTPAAHKFYWTDNDFTKPVTEQLRALLNLL